MPELPEVETVRRGIEPRLIGRRLRGATVRSPRLRYPLDARLHEQLAGAKVLEVGRRAKYLILRTDRGSLLLHLGMSGTLRFESERVAASKHDHLDLLLPRGQLLRFNDPRRFGLALWTEQIATEHPLLRNLGPEPLGTELNGTYLYQRSRNRRVAAKSFLMDGKIVVGVGNIYASEALWRATISPTRPAGRIALHRYEKLSQAVRSVLTEAIEQGGTTLKNFRQTDGQLGAFSQHLDVYGRDGEACPRCASGIRRAVIGQRASFWCPQCQT